MLGTLGTMSMGVRLPIIKQNDELENIIVSSIINASDESNIPIEDGDIIGITESIVARANGLYITVDDIAESVKKKLNNPKGVYVLWPIYSRNRFSMILKGIARAVPGFVQVILDEGKDEVGNKHVNQFTGVDIREFYRNLIEEEGSHPIIHSTGYEKFFKNLFYDAMNGNKINVIVATIHNRNRLKQVFESFNSPDKLENGTAINVITLEEICDEFNPDFGVLGTNKATEETLKLFPTIDVAKRVALKVQEDIEAETGKHVEVLIYGDGCFKDPVGGIWEFADPVSAPYYTDGLEGTPNELKLKYVADNESSDEDFIRERIKHKKAEMAGQMITQGTTPRMYRDLVASLCDLTSGSGDKGTPVIWIKNYFKNYAD